MFTGQRLACARGLPPQVKAFVQSLPRSPADEALRLRSRSPGSNSRFRGKNGTEPPSEPRPRVRSRSPGSKGRLRKLQAARSQLEAHAAEPAPVEPGELGPGVRSRSPGSNERLRKLQMARSQLGAPRALSDRRDESPSSSGPRSALGLASLRKEEVAASQVAHSPTHGTSYLSDDSDEVVPPGSLRSPLGDFRLQS